MNFQVIVEPDAILDLNAAFGWYEEQLDGLGKEFIISVEASFSQLERTPEIYQTIFENIRRAPIKRFPFGLFYLIRKQIVHVVAIYHSRRDPDGWKKRIYEVGSKSK